MPQVLGVGSEFAGYRIDDQLARGGMSEVYLAHNMRLESKVVLKLLAPELAEDVTFRERFVRESRIAASLDHPNVIPIHDAGEFDGLPYIAMRYVQGPDLKELVRREGPLPVERALSIIGQVAGALDRAHAGGLIHRDVKPGNILIDERGEDGSRDHVYLTDFGVAKHTLSRSGLTSTGQFVGTIDYVAPEQIEGKPLDGRTDVYSLGCVLYEALTGMPPFERESNAALIYAHLLEPPPSVHEQRPELPAELDAVIATALAKSPEERYPTAKALVEAARASVAAEPVTNGTGASVEAAVALSGATVAAPRTEPAPTEPGEAGQETLGPPETVAAQTGDPGATRDVRAEAPARRSAEPLPAAPTSSPGQPPARRRRFFSKPIAIAAGALVLATAAAAAAGQTIMGSGGDDKGPAKNEKSRGSGGPITDTNPYSEQVAKARRRVADQRKAERRERANARQEARQKVLTARQRAQALQRQRATARAQALQRARERIQAQQRATDARRRAEELRRRIERCRELAKRGIRC